MRDLRVQYFLTYCVIGAVLPYGSVFFRQAGLSAAQVERAFADFVRKQRATDPLRHPPLMPPPMPSVKPGVRLAKTEEWMVST